MKKTIIFAISIFVIVLGSYLFLKGKETSDQDAMRENLFECLRDVGASQFEGAWSYPQEIQDAVTDCNERFPFYVNRRSLFNY